MKRLTTVRWYPYLFIMPSFLLLVALVIYPTFFVISNSFYFWNLQTSPTSFTVRWSEKISSWSLQQRLSSPTLRNTLVLAFVGTAVEFWFGMAIALLLNVGVRGASIFRSLLIMPVTIAPVVTGFLFRYMYYREGGLVTWLLLQLGVPVSPRGLLGEESTALAAVLAADVWQWTPYAAILLYAGLLAIPDEVKEAARVDGASAWRMFWHITLPLVRPTAAIFYHVALYATVQYV